MAFPKIVTTKRAATELVGTLSRPSKMPGKAYGIPAQACDRGQRMAKIEGSVCSICYADGRGNYRFDNVKRSQELRLALWHDAETPEQWAQAMALLIDQTREDFRWFESGDVQSPTMAYAVLYAAMLTPARRHWVSTREQKYWREGIEMFCRLMRVDDIPSNITIRVSADFLGKAPVNRVTGQSATVHDPKRPETLVPGAHVCPAPEQGNQCRDCRACWSRDVPLVSYEVH